MQTRKILFGLAIALFATSSLVAQDSDKKAKKALDRLVKSQTTQMMKHFAAAKLTDEQKEKASAVITKHAPTLMEARKAQDATLTADQMKLRKDAVKKAKEAGKKGSKVWDEAHKAMKLSEESEKKFAEAKKKITGITDKLKTEIATLLTDDQKTAMSKKKGKGAGKKAKEGKGKKKDKKATEGDGQTVSLKLPNMVWGGCARSVRTALTAVDGVADIKTNPAERSCTFNAPKDLDVTATLNKIVEDGNSHIKDWTIADEEGE